MECSDNVPNAKYSFHDSLSSIIVNPSYFSQFSMAVLIAAICHELGHFKLNHHTASSDRDEMLQQELSADSICGYYMRKLNFSRPEEAFEVLNTASESESGKYPSKEKRKENILKGWRKASDENNLISYASYSPRVIWEITENSLLIKIDEREIFKLSTWYNHGAVYDPLTNSTFQLLKYRNKQGICGIGRLVTNKTNITYRRNGNSGFSIYENGRELKKIYCQKNNPLLKTDDQNLEFTCWNESRKTNVTYLLVDYKYAPDKYLMPAFTK